MKIAKVVSTKKGTKIGVFWGVVFGVIFCVLFYGFYTLPLVKKEE